MLLSELAARAEVPVATVKFYMRAGLLPPGQMTGPRRAEYDDGHLRRLRLVRMLREIGDIPVATLQRILDALGDDARSSHDVFCLAADALTETYDDLPVDEPSRELVDDALAQVGWSAVRPDALDRRQLGALVRLLHAEGPLTIDPEVLSFYVGIADCVCRAEIGFIDRQKDRAGTLEDALAGEAIFGRVLTLLRRMGHEHYHAVGRHVPVDEPSVAVTT